MSNLRTIVIAKTDIVGFTPKTAAHTCGVVFSEPACGRSPDRVAGRHQRTFHAPIWMKKCGL